MYKRIGEKVSRAKNIWEFKCSWTDDDVFGSTSPRLNNHGGPEKQGAQAFQSEEEAHGRLVLLC
jgi:hypothetical protein